MTYELSDWANSHRIPPFPYYVPILQIPPSATISGGSNVTNVWNFGDREDGFSSAVSHVYIARGIYAVTVTASNSVGQSE